MELFRSRLAKVFATRLQDEETFFLADLLEFVNEGMPTSALYGTAEATQICEMMGENDDLMISEGVVYKL